MKYNWAIHKVITGFMKTIYSVLWAWCAGKEPQGPSGLMNSILF